MVPSWTVHAQPPPGFISQLLLADLDEPVAIDFLPDGRMLIAQRTGKVRMAAPPYTSVLEPPVVQITNLQLVGEKGGQGVLNILVDPDFGRNGHFYLFYTAQLPARHRISRFTLNPATNRASPSSERIIWQDRVPHNLWHFGGAMAFGPDGFFYFTTGDNHAPNSGGLHVSQDVTRSWGKLMRVRLIPDGSGPIWHPYYSIPLDNPFWDGFGPNYDEIYAIGLRNPFRMTFDPQGRLLVSDVGGNVAQTAWEELNLAAPGANFGWPLCEGAVCQAGTSGVTDPLFAYSHEYPPGSGQYGDASITGGFVYTGDLFPPAYQGAYFYGDYVHHTIRYLTFDGQGQVSGDHPFAPADGSRGNTGVGDLVDLKQGPDGALYYVDIAIPFGEASYPNAGTVRRIAFNTTGNEPPTVTFTASVTSGIAPLTVTFAAVAHDPEGAELTYRWYFGDGQTSDVASPVYTYTRNGHFAVKLAVSDDVHTAFAGPLRITVGQPPEVTITAPISGTTFRAGDLIAYAGQALDPDGTLLLYSWRVLLHHDSHVHPFIGPICCRAEGSFQIERAGHSWEGNTWFEIVLLVSDADRLQTQRSVAIYPETVDLRFATAPSGLEVRFDERTARTPFAHSTLIGFHHEVAAAPQQRLEESVYEFLGWVDGGSPTLTLVTPAQSTDYTAVYQPVSAAELLLVAGPIQSRPASLALLRQLRAGWLTRSALGRHYSQLYDQHSPAIVTLLWADRELWSRGFDLLQQFVPGLTALVAGRGQELQISVELIASLLTFLEDLAVAADQDGHQDLRRTIAEELGRVNWPGLAGATFTQAWGAMQIESANLADLLALPLFLR